MATLARSSALALAFASTALGGCSTYVMPRYYPPAENIAAIRALATQKVGVGAFTTKVPNNGTLPCRLAGNIETPSGESFETYVQQALAADLVYAGAYDPKSPVLLTGTLDAMDFESHGGTWTLAATISSTLGTTVSVREIHSTSFIFEGQSACTQGAQNGMRALQNLLMQLVRQPSFVSLLGPTPPPPPPKD
jgi:hypothetical protein